MEDEIETIGDMDFDSADDANVPVDIWLTEEKDDDDKPTGFWRLKASNYMPRKACIGSEFAVRSRNMKALQRIIRDKVLPLYAVAIGRISEMSGVSEEVVRLPGAPSLYYWH